MRILTLLLLSFTLSLYAVTSQDFADCVTFDKNDEPIQLDNLRGKVVITLFYQSWCPVCNGWAPELIKQTQDKYGDQPGYVLIGVKTDGGTPDEAKKFFAGKGADLSKWIIASDENQVYYKKVNKEAPLWGYYILSPDGKSGIIGNGGEFYKSDKGKGKDFALPLARKELDKKYAASIATFLPAGKNYGDALVSAVNYAETGRFLSAINAARKVGGETAKELENDVVSQLEIRVEKLNEDLKQVDNPERYYAYMALRDMAECYKALSIGKIAKIHLGDISKDKQIQREQKSEKSWQALLVSINKLAPEKRDPALKENAPKFIKAYEGTYFAGVAESMMKK